MAASPTITSVYWTAFKDTGSSLIQLNNIQQVNVNIGRRQITDLYTAGTASIQGRDPNSLPSLLIGDLVRIRMNYTYPGQPAGADPSVQYDFRVADLQIEYGIVPDMDTWLLDLEDAFAYLGRASLPTTTIASGTSTATAAFNIASAAGLTMAIIPGTTTTTSAQTVTGQNAMDVFQTLANTEAAWVTAGGNELTWYPRNVWQDALTYFTFSDNGNAIDYNEFQVASLADNYAEQVVVRPRGSSDVIVGTGIFSYNLDSYSFDTGEASNLASFWQASLDVDDTTPRQVSILLNGNNKDAAAAMSPAPIALVVEFRTGVYSSTVNVVTGMQIFGSLESTRATFFLSSIAFIDFLLLDSTVYGFLDTNKLGW